MPPSNAIRAGRAYVEIAADPTRLDSGLREAESKVSDCSARINALQREAARANAAGDISRGHSFAKDSRADLEIGGPRWEEIGVPRGDAVASIYLQQEYLMRRICVIAVLAAGWLVGCQTEENRLRQEELARSRQASLQAVDRIRDIAMQTEQYPPAIASLERIAATTCFDDVRHMALLAVADLYQQQNQPEKAMEALARLAGACPPGQTATAPACPPTSQTVRYEE